MKKKVSKSLLLLITMLLLLAMPMAANAASAKTTTKTKALKAYSKMLAKTTLKVKGTNIGKAFTSTLKTSKLKFAVVYLDNDSVPELMIQEKGCGAYYIFTYKNGKVKQTGNFIWGMPGGDKTHWGYYKKKSILVNYDTTTCLDYYRYTGTNWKSTTWASRIAAKEKNFGVWSWWSYEEGNINDQMEQKCTRATFNSIVNVGSTKMSKISLVSNTKSNRTKYLK